VDTDLNAVSAAVPQLPVLNKLDTEISAMEIEHAIAALKNNKSPGSDGIPAELLSGWASAGQAASLPVSIMLAEQMHP